MASQSIFSRIISGEIPGHIIAETDEFIAFLDARPLVKGHALAVPKKQIDYIFDLEDDQLSGLMVFAKRVAKAQKQAISCERIAVSVIGLEVPHAHVHLVPLNRISELNFSNPRVEISDQEYAELAAQIKQAFI
jgi:histidine triad (HIT) family protein